MTNIVCPKCNKLNANATGAPDEACPHCGVIYAKARPGALPVAAPARRVVVADAPPSSAQEFLKELRAKSAYPAFRAVVGFATIVGYLITALAVVAGIVATWKGAGPGPVIYGLLGGFALYVATRVFKEMWLMLADLTDATVRMARESDRASTPQ